MPNLVAVKELKSNLFASWNPRGDKFCVGGSSGHVFVGTHNAELNFWVAISQTEEPPLGKPLHKASVMTVRFDPGSGRALASASADGTVVITSAFISEIPDPSRGWSTEQQVNISKLEMFKKRTNRIREDIKFPHFLRLMDQVMF